MRRLYGLLAAVALAAASGCLTVTPAPGADKLRVTSNAADVASCAPVGNIRVSKNDQGLVDAATAPTEFRNQAVGFGANAALVTMSGFGIPVEGIAYRCP